MKNYAKHINVTNTPVTEKAKANQVPTNSGGFAFAVSDWQQFQRFLILGSENGAYRVSERKLTKENAEAAQRVIAGDGVRAVAEIVRVSDGGKAPKNDAAIFALALACCADDVETRRYAFSVIPHVCRIGTHLFQFVATVKELRSFGKGLRQGIADWYEGKTPEQLAFQICKYQQRDGMSHRDVLRLIHVDSNSPEHNAIYRYIVCGVDGVGGRTVNNKKAGHVHEYAAVQELPDFIGRFEELKNADEKRTIELINNHGFTHEMINTVHKNSPAVWEALLQKMPLHAMIRNLNKMTAIGLVKPLSAATKLVNERLGDENQIHRSRLHPLTLLGAIRQYSKGHGDKGSLSWVPVPNVIEALEGAFEKSFDFVEPSNKNFLLALDCSASMTWEIPGTGMNSAEVVACLALVTARKEPNYHILGFSHQLVDLGITPKMSIQEVGRRVQLANFGSTNCALPFEWATKNRIDVDVFCVYTDNDLNTGYHPFAKLKEYRKTMNKPNAKSIVLATTASNFTIADPSDPLQLDIAGFSTDVPAVISSFASD